MHQLAPKASQQMKERSSAINKIHSNFHKKRMLEFSKSKNKLNKKKSYEKVFMNSDIQGQQTIDQRIQQRQRSLVKSNSIELPDIYALVTKQQDNNLNLAFKNHLGTTFKTRRLYGLIKNLNESQQKLNKYNTPKNESMHIFNPEHDKYDLKNSVNNVLIQERKRLQSVSQTVPFDRYKQAVKNSENKRYQNSLKAYAISDLNNNIPKDASQVQARRSQYASLDASKAQQKQKLKIYNMMLTNMNLHDLGKSESGNFYTIQSTTDKNKSFLASHSKKFPVIFSPKSSMSNYYQPKYRSQHEEQRRIKQQYLSYINRINMETIHQERFIRRQDHLLQGEQMELINQTRIQQLKKQAENMKKYIQVMKNTASLTFTMSLHDRRQNFEFQKRQNQRKYYIQHKQIGKQKKKRTKKIQLDLNEKLECSPWGQDISQHMNISDFLKKM